MTTAASGEPIARPPELAASTPEAAVRPTARTRPRLPVRMVKVDDGFEPGDPYVRRYWVAAIGAGAVAELMRLVKAAEAGEWLPLPRWLPVLMRNDLVKIVHGQMVVASLIPIVPPILRRRFPPGLVEEHRRRYLVTSRPRRAGGGSGGGSSTPR